MASYKPLISVGDTFTVDIFTAHCGIYAIVNTKTDRAYIGQSVDILDRWKDHYHKLARGKQENKALIKDWHEYGAKAFEFKVIEMCHVDRLDERERYWIDTCKPTPYNLMESPNVLGIRREPKPKPLTEEYVTLQPASYEFVADMFVYYTLRGMPPYIREIFDRWLALESTQDWVLT